MNEKEAKGRVNQFRQAAYETGYYSGRQQDGQPHHAAAVKLRDELGRELIALLTSADAKPEPKVMTKAELEDVLGDVRLGSVEQSDKATDRILAHDARLRELLRAVWPDAVIALIDPNLRAEIEYAIQGQD